MEVIISAHLESVQRGEIVAVRHSDNGIVRFTLTVAQEVNRTLDAQPSSIRTYDGQHWNTMTGEATIGGPRPGQRLMSILLEPSQNSL